MYVCAHACIHVHAYMYLFHELSSVNNYTCIHVHNYYYDMKQSIAGRAL